jgi:4-amino-4-deoxy-L-arabinose transferase-like glycosyltransferase
MPSLLTPQRETVTPKATHRGIISPKSIAILVVAWLILQLGGIFSPGLLDDVDSIYIQIAREMMLRHDYVTPCIDGIRFFDKPPLMYWMAAGSMSIFGVHDWAARLPLAVAVLVLLLSVYVLGNRLFAAVSPAHAPDRGGFYSALAVATAIGPYLYTRFFIPDILIALWMTLGVHLFLIALERIPGRIQQRASSPGDPRLASETWATEAAPKSPLLPCLGFAAVMGLNLLTKGLIGVVFPVGFVLLYLASTRQLHLLRRFHPLASAAVLLAVAAPWHILAALRNPAIVLPPGLGLPARGGWAWFYLYNEHFARFLSKRIPHDYGQTPVWLFWLFTALWTMPWATFLPVAIAAHIRNLRARATSTARQHEAALALTLWAGIVLGFFTLSARQEYYALPAIPALCLMAGGLLARADVSRASTAARGARHWSLWFLTPLATVIALICAWFAIFSPHAPAGTTLAQLLATDKSLYNLSLGHLSDLTGAAMGFFRRPLAAVALGMVALGPASTLLRRRGHGYAANLTLAAGMTVTLLAAHTGLARFYPILGSKELAETIDTVIQPNDLVVIDGELTAGSSLIFYTGRPVHVVDGRVNGLWYGSFWPDAPDVFETDASLHALWASPRRIFLLTYETDGRQRDLARFGPVHLLALSGGKSVLSNR